MKNFSIALLFSAMVAALSSCEQKESFDDVGHSSAPVELVISAVSSKTLLEGENVLWLKGDVLKVYDDTRSAKTFVASFEEETAANASFICQSWTDGKEPLWAMFNGGAQALDMSDMGLFSVSVPDVQTVSESGSFAPDANISVGRIEKTEDVYVVEMKNVCGVLEFELASGIEDLVAVTIEDEGGEAMLAGDIAVSYNDGAPTYEVVSGKEKVTVNLAEGTMADGKYYVCVLPEVTFTPKFTFTRGDGVSASVTLGTGKVGRAKIAQLGIVDASVDFGDTKTVTLDFLGNWDNVFACPKVSDMASNTYMSDFYTVQGYLFSYANTLSRQFDHGIYAWDKVISGKFWDLPAVNGMKLISVSVDLGSDATKSDYDTNSGKPYICTKSGNVIADWKSDENYEHGFTNNAGEEYTFSLKDTEESVQYALGFNESVTRFGLQSITLKYKGEEAADVTSITTLDPGEAAFGTLVMNGSFTISDGSFSDFTYGFRYKSSDSEEWTYITSSSNSDGVFTSTAESLPAGNYVYCAWASYGGNGHLYRYGVPKEAVVSVQVQTELVEYDSVVFSDLADDLPGKDVECTGETAITVGEDTYTISGQEGVYYYLNSGALYFGRTSSDIDSNACGFIELPSKAGHTLKSVAIIDAKSTKTYRVYDYKKSIYDYDDKGHLGTVAAAKSTDPVTLTVNGAEAGKKYYLCVPIFAYPSAITLTYEVVKQ